MRSNTEGLAMKRLAGLVAVMFLLPSTAIPGAASP